MGMGKKKRKKHGHEMVIEFGVVEARRASPGSVPFIAAIGAGSFAVEYIRRHPDVLAAFQAWLDDRCPGKPTAAESFTAESMEKIDMRLTVLAADLGGFGPLAEARERVKAGTNGHAH
jgi:hypothetical protein